MKIVGTVDIINRLAQATGHGAQSKLGRACKSVLQLRNRSDGRQFLVISTRKDVIAHEYDVKFIQKIRSMFAKDGIATIEVSQPPMNVMVRNCNPEELQGFIGELEKIIGKQISTGKTKEGTSSLRPSQSENYREQEEKPGSLRKSTGSLKRPRSPDLSKTAAAKAQKCLKSSNSAITVKSKDKYPKEFVSTLEQIKMQGIGLKIVDRRIMRLKWLTLLDLSRNRIKNIEHLATLKCKLRSLVLTQNEIGGMPDDIFSHSPFDTLMHLDLSHNQLSRLPSSLVTLAAVVTLNVNNNNLTYLPYNWQQMRNLRTLNVSSNRLSFIPKTTGLLQLTRLDMSHNVGLQTPLESIEYFGCFDVPTLFEAACESTMNHLRNKRISDPGLLPTIIQSYLKIGKLCWRCGQMALRFRAVTTSQRTQELCVGAMSACLISPAAPCNVKTVTCASCTAKESRTLGRRLLMF